MAAFLTDLSPLTAPAAAAFPPSPGASHPRPIAAFAMVGTVLRAIGERVFLLWMVTAIAFFILIVAGAAGLVS